MEKKVITIDVKEILEFVFENNLQFVDCEIDNKSKCLYINFTNEHDLSDCQIDDVFIEMETELGDKYQILDFDINVEETTCIVVLNNEVEYALSNN